MDILICGGGATAALDLCCLIYEQGHTVCGTTSNHDQCMAKAQKTRPDLVLVNVDVDHERTGLGLVETLAKNGTPSIVIAADAGQVPSTTSATAVIGKTVSQPRLASAIADVERNRRPQATGR